MASSTESVFVRSTFYILENLLTKRTRERLFLYDYYYLQRKTLGPRVVVCTAAFTLDFGARFPVSAV